MVDRLAVRGGKDHAMRDVAAVERLRADDVVVHDGLVHRDRQRFVSAERDGVGELLLVVDPVDVQDADADAVRADAEPDALARQLVLLEELVERAGERRDVPDLAADDDAGLERLARELARASEPPLLCTSAAAIWDAPTFTPTSSCFLAFFVRSRRPLASTSRRPASASESGPRA